MDLFSSPFFRFVTEPKRLLLAIFLYCTGLVVLAMILVHFVDLVPCPLCIVQRFFYILVGLTALSGALSWTRWLTPVRTGLGVSFFSLGGWFFAARQVWLQHFFVSDKHSGGCPVSFGSFFDSVIEALGGVGNCATIDWTMFGLSIADWSLIAFTLLAVAGILVSLRAHKSTSQSDSSLTLPAV